MDDDFGGDFFENEDYGAFVDEDAGFNDFNDGETLQDFAGGAVVTSQANATADALAGDEEIILPPVKVVNCVVAFHTDCDIDLRRVTISTRNVEYNPRKVNAAIVRFVHPRLTATIYPGGRVTICGRATLPDIKKTAKLTAKLIQKAGHPEARFTNFRINTLICTA